MYNVLTLVAGNKIRVVDTSNNVDEVLLIEKVNYLFPTPIDDATFGFQYVNFRDDMINVNERLRKLEREQLTASDVVVDVREGSYDVDIHWYTRIVDGTTGTANTFRVIHKDDTYIEDFRNDDFKQTATADWDNTGGTGAKGVLSYG